MASLWTPENWPERLNELAARDFEGKQAPLRRDIRSLGMLLGEVLREQAGDKLFERVEALRKIAIARREAEGAEDGVRAGAEMEEALALTRDVAADPVQAYRLARAFASYFELINLAETNHRKRRRRAALLAEGDKVQPGTVQRGSLRGTLRRLREGGSTREEVLALLARVRIFPVFTAHPTEVARRSVMFKRRRISDLLEQLDAVAVPPSELGALQDALLAEITALWQTDDVRSARPTVRDEVRMALDYYESAIFATVPVLYAEIAAALQAEFPLDAETPRTAIPTPLTALPVVVQFGSWIGGDRDGNPFVTAAVTQDALQASRELLYGHYLARLSEAFDQLGSSTNQASISEALTARLEEYLGLLHRAATETFALPQEAVRLHLACITLRLGGDLPASMQRNLQVPADAALPPYERAAELLDDLTLLQESLAANHGKRLAELWVEPLLLEVRTFGLHLQTLDVRQHARVHELAVRELASGSGLASDANEAPLALPAEPSAQTAEVLATFRGIAAVKQMGA